MSDSEKHKVNTTERWQPTNDLRVFRAITQNILTYERKSSKIREESKIKDLEQKKQTVKDCKRQITSIKKTTKATAKEMVA